MSPEEVSEFLDAVESLKHRVILTVCYAAGLRISEAVHLTPAAMDSRRMTIRVEQGKGRKDRYVMLSPKLLEILRDYYRRVRPKQWLFPGECPWSADHRLRRGGCLPDRAVSGGPREAGHAARVAPRLCRPSP